MILLPFAVVAFAGWRFVKACVQSDIDDALWAGYTFAAWLAVMVVWS